MIIALINWRILPHFEAHFLDRWKTGLRLEGQPGLIGEFLSKVEGPSFHEGVTWQMEADELDDPSAWRSNDFVSYVNIGMWNSAEEFMNAVMKYASKGRTLKEEFEAAPRRRAILTPEAWRRGDNDLPSGLSAGVLL